jgi:hypothetical protein
MRARAASECDVDALDITAAEATTAALAALQTADSTPQLAALSNTAETDPCLIIPGIM